MVRDVAVIILLCLGGFLLFRGLPGVLQMIVARGWKPVPGTVVEDGGSVAYTYEVAGRTYIGDRVVFGTPPGFGALLGGIAEGQAGRYEPGQRVEVFVHPVNPRQSVLSRSAPSSLVISTAAVAVLALAVAQL